MKKEVKAYFDFGAFRDILFDVMARSGVSDDILYVYKKTGILFTQKTLPQLSPDQIKTAQRALAEYKNLLAQTVDKTQ